MCDQGFRSIQKRQPCLVYKFFSPIDVHRVFRNTRNTRCIQRNLAKVILATSLRSSQGEPVPLQADVATKDGRRRTIRSVLLGGSTMNVAADSLFLFHADPMWIFDLNTLRFLAVNNAAVAKYGYSRDEFLSMTIADIRPEEDRIALQENVAAMTEGLDEAGVWRHCLKSGKVIHVDITGHTIDYDGRPAELIAARDVSRLVVAEQIANEALVREQIARRSSDTLARQFQIMFDSVPGIYLVFSPQTFDVVAVSDAYIASCGGQRSIIVGSNLFDVLPVPAEDMTHSNLRQSIEIAVSSEKVNLLDVQSFVIPRPDSPLVKDHRYWVMSNTPVIGPNGKLLHLILRIQDVTDAIIADEILSATQSVSSVKRAKIDMIAHTRELKSDNVRLTELASRLRITQRLLGTGTWDYAIAENRLIWSSNVYDMYGLTPESFGHSFNDYLQLVHPDDRTAMRVNFDSFMASGDTHFAFAHQIRRPDGEIVHVQGVAELTDSPMGALLSGVVQNVTESVAATRALARAKRLLEIAGTSAKFGAWSYDVLKNKLEWSAQTARIHDEAEGFSPTILKGLRYYAPEYRQHIETLFNACLDQGKPFDEILEIISAKGRRLWVRATGEPETDENGRTIAIQGSFQEISELVTVRKRAEESEKLLGIAGRAVRLGGWSVSLTDQKVFWTDGIAAIHELPPGTMPTFEGGIDFFAPEEREAARAVFDACALQGIPFDNVRDIITAKGNRAKVRSLGVPVRDGAGNIIAVQGAMQDVSELTAAQQKADELSTRLAETLENIGDAFFTLDRDWQFTYLNGRAESLLERRRDQLIGRKVFDVFPEAIGTESDTQYKRAFDTGETVRFEQFFPPLQRTFRVNAHPTPDGLAVYFSDISEERRRQNELRLLNAAVARLNDIVVITEAGDLSAPHSPKIVYVNDAFERRTGFTREEAVGQTPRILQGPKTQRSELNRIRSALEAKLPVSAEVINYTKSGQEYWLEIDIVPIANEGGPVTHFVAIERDITGRRKVEETLRVSETRFRLIARATGNAVWEWDTAGEQEWWSDGLAEVFGYASDTNKLPDVWRANVHPEDKPRIDEAWGRLLSGQADGMHEVYRFRRADGTWATVEDRAFAIHDDEGQALRVLGSMADITDRHQLEEQLRQSQKLEAVGHLTGGVAHDFNNLLMVIIGNSEFIQDALTADHPLRHFVDMIAQAADRATELTSRLLAFSRKQPLQPRVIDLNGVIEGVGAMLHRTLGEDINIAVTPAGNLWRTEVDPGQFETALLNLAVNSRDAMPDGGVLTIETANAVLDDSYVANEPGLMAGPYVLVAISDTGMGIPHDQIGHVFEPFFTTKSVGQGTGLGLSMVYGFVKQTGGHIRIYSEPNEGTTVKLYFPRFSGDQEASDTVTIKGPEQRGQETILVVEDDKLILQQLTVQLVGLGYKVISASDGPTALAVLLARSDIDLLFTDIVLPGGMNGRQIADAAKKMQPGLRVLYTSGYTQNAIVHHGRVDAGVELLSKPYRRSDLAAKVRKVLDS
jgi:PAS domain S-box-containing protein